MQHLGDITKINGRDAPPVEVMIGGSPCQDLSIAGRREGLNGARSGLFMEQIRIIKEMRSNDRANGRSDESVRPRFMVWENVPGAFSSNKGEDFRTVLEETARVADENAAVPRPPKGKWTNAGCIMGDGWSIAWRVLDAQFWGVPQRRRRIALVADFGGHAAPEILFERKSVSGDFEESGEEGQGAARTAERCADTAGSGIAVVAIENHPADSRVKLSKDNRVQCLSSRMGTGGGNIPMVMSKETNAVCIGNGQADQLKVSEKVGALNCMHDQQAVIARSIVRRLTPLECTRLQGFPDGWVDIGEWTDSKGKKHKDADSPKYKALGNSIAIPPWMYVLSRLNRYCTEHTMASLFDGIGGFPLIWETFNGRGSCIWASEVEEFPIAVTKLRFGGCKNGNY